MAALCRWMRCLPGDGGLLDQDPYWIAVFKLVMEAEGAKSQVDHARAELEQRRQRADPRMK